MFSTEVEVDAAAAAGSAVDLQDAVHAIARSIARSGGRVVAVSVLGVGRSWSVAIAPAHSAAIRDADGRVVSTESRP